MFKKPKRNFRGRKADSTTDDAEPGNDDEATENGTGNGTPTFLTDVPGVEVIDVDEDSSSAVDKIPKKKKKKKDKEGMGKKSSSVLSFEADEGDSDEIFTIKKSSHSKKYTKQLKKELQREKEIQQEKKNKTQKKVFTPEEENNSSKPDTPKSREGSLGPGSDVDFSDNEEPTFNEMLRGGQIPDAAMIHAIRKKRQLARDLGDFVPVDDTVRYSEDKSRLIRDDENDESEEEERVDFTVATSSSESNLRKIQQTILEAHEESEESDHDWEVQQIRKGVSIPAQSKDGKDGGEEAMYYGGFEQFVYSGNTQASNTPTFTLEPENTYAASPDPIKRTVPMSDLPKINMELMVQRLRERLEDLSTNHRVHSHECQDLSSRIESCESSIVTLSNNTEGLAAQYRFFQEMRGYVTDLVECLSEKIPQVMYLEKSLVKLWQKRAEKVCQRWQQDIKDESEDMRMCFAKSVAVDPNTNPEKQRRVAEREARRTRRKRKREKQGIVDHQDGFSTDDEQSPSEIAHYNSEKERLSAEAERLFEDVEEDFSQISGVKSRFERWRNEQGESYHEAYIGLCLPKLFTPFVKLKLIQWNPLEGSCADFQSSDWFETLMFFGYREGRQVARSDDDLKVMPSIIEKVLVPKLTGIVESVWNPLSSKQSQRLVQTLTKSLALYPTLHSDSLNTKLLVKAIVTRIRKCLDNDVFMPLCPKQMLENKGPGSNFFYRQLNVCIKLLGNILLWHGVIGEKALQEMALDALLNRYIMLGLRNSPFNQETLSRCQQIMNKFPKEWFSSLQDDKTIPQLENLCGFLSQSVVTLQESGTAKDFQQINPREMVVKPITKMLVGVHALEHALSLANKFSVRL